jgi:hypothetical protein
VDVVGDITIQEGRSLVIQEGTTGTREKRYELTFVKVVFYNNSRVTIYGFVNVNGLPDNNVAFNLSADSFTLPQTLFTFAATSAQREFLTTFDL